MPVLISGLITGLLTGLITSLLVGLAPLSLPGMQVPSAAAARAPRFAEEPLVLTLDQLSPAAIPRRGKLTVAGTVTNNSTQVWTDIGLYPLTSATPMTNEAEFDAALSSDPALPVGDRITDLGPFTVIDRLEPGQSSRYSFSLPRRLLAISGEPGVYWFAVQALGAVDGVRDQSAIADGRVRTFLPLISPREQRRAKLALVVPLRRSVMHRVDGRLADVEGWVTDLAPDGRLGRLLSIGERTSEPITWLVDPAVLAAVRQLARQNPGYNLGAFDPEAGPVASPKAQAEDDPASPQESPDDQGSPNAQPDQQIAPLGATAEQAAVAENWWRTFREVVADDQILALPYGDLDVAAANAHDRDTYTSARTTGDSLVAELGLTADPAVAPISGTLPSDALGMLSADTLTLLTPRSLADLEPAEAGDIDLQTASSVRLSGRRIVRAPWLPENPAPDEPHQIVGLRQLLASRAALSLVGQPDDPSPVVIVQVPSRWELPETSQLFSGLTEQPWFTLSRLDSALASGPAPTTQGSLRYPDRQAERELDAAAFLATRKLQSRAASLDEVLTGDRDLGTQITRSGLTSLSYSDRNAPYVSRLGTEGTSDWLDRQLSRISVEVPRSFLVPGEAGRFPVSVRNGLNQTVQVKVAVSSDNTLTIAPTDTLTLRPGESLSPVLQVKARGIGVHYVTVEVIDPSGQVLSSSKPLPVRSTVRVGGILWTIMGIGAALLFLAIFIRLTRRFLAWRRGKVSAR